MADIYIRWIQIARLSLADVPARWFQIVSDFLHDSEVLL